MKNVKGFNNPNYKHGYSSSRLYVIHNNMHARCYNPKNKRFNRYGGRGIKICDEWLHNLKAFGDWALANGYSPELTIDRINNDGDYCPENCRWVDIKTQANNKEFHTGVSNIRGVSWHKISKKWSARITINNKRIWLGLFDSVEEAREAQIKYKGALNV